MRSSFRLPSLLACLLSLAPVVSAQWLPVNPVKNVEPQADGALIALERGFLRFEVCSDSIVHVVYSMEHTVEPHPDFIVIKKSCSKSQFSINSDDPKLVALMTPSLRITVARDNSVIVFYDSAGQKLAEETTRTLTPVEVNGEKTYHAERFSGMWGPQEEAFYGLGQHQAGVMNYRGESVEISQDNTNISIPILLSSNGYGIFWNNGSRTRFNNRFVHSLYINSEVADSIDYYFLYGPDFDKIIASYRDLTGQTPLFGKWAYGYWQCKNKYSTQEELLGVAHKYRDLHIPIDNVVQDWFWWVTMGDPVFDAQRYPDPQGMLDDLHKNNFHLMISVWPYFRPHPENDNTPDPVYQDMDKHGFFVAKTVTGGFHPAGQALYDPFNPEARRQYWKLMNDNLFKIGVDAWWLDTTEPETEGRENNILVDHKVNGGNWNGARYANEFALLTTTGVYEGQRAASNAKRVFILSRSGFAGSQRNAAAVWSGDVHSNWETFRRQIPAGLNYSVSGNPYWTTDIGGFVDGNPADPGYRELYMRWFQFGVFCPIFRAHGTRSTNQNEIWSYGPEAQKILTAYDQLRYRLMPYIYSLAWKTTSEGYTIMRPLVMDFRNDTRAQNIPDQYLFGPAILVTPVNQPGATWRRVYLPNGTWYDFWTGATTPGPRTIDSPAPLDRLPLFVRAGSILPLGPDLEYATEKPAEPIEIRVYRGANGSFTLYEDENDNYNYEKGAHATIPFTWDDAAHTLTIGDRVGKFPGMLESRTFRVVFVSENHGTGGTLTQTPDKSVTYSGKSVSINP